MATTLGWRASSTSSSTITSGSSAALCGCVPTERNTVSWAPTLAFSSLKRCTRVEMVTISPTPAARARSSTASSSDLSSGKSRWQWLSAIITLQGFLRLDMAREHWAWRRQFCSGCEPSFRPKHGKIARIVRHTELIEQLARAFRHDWLHQNRYLARDLSRDIEDRLHPPRVGLLMRPGLLAGEIAIGVGDQRPDDFQRAVNGEIVDGLRDSCEGAVGFCQDGPVGLAKRAWLGHAPPAILGDHRQRALGEIAEIVGEVGVDALHDALAAVIAVLAERHFAQQKIAERVDAVILPQHEGIDPVANLFPHLHPAIIEKAV